MKRLHVGEGAISSEREQGGGGKEGAVLHAQYCLLGRKVKGVLYTFLSPLGVSL